MMIVKEVETLTIRISKRIYSLRAHVRVCVCKRVHPHVFGYLRIYFYFYLNSCCTKAKSENQAQRVVVADAFYSCFAFQNE